MNTHGSIGPSCAVADFKDGSLTVWTPSQASSLLRPQSATMLQLPLERVRCIFVEGAGCYGRNGADDCAAEAALIAVGIGRPVRLQWMRADEHGWDPKGPPTCSITAPVLMTKAGSPPGNPTYSLTSYRFSARRTLLAAVLARLPKFGIGGRDPTTRLGYPV